MPRDADAPIATMDDLLQRIEEETERLKALPVAMTPQVERLTVVLAQALPLAVQFIDRDIGVLLRRIEALEGARQPQPAAVRPRPHRARRAEQSGISAAR